MSTRWKPKAEWYWYITLSENGTTNTYFLGDYLDRARVRIGNCFKTKKEAKAALEKIKQVLLEAHDDTTK